MRLDRRSLQRYLIPLVPPALFDVIERGRRHGHRPAASPQRSDEAATGKDSRASALVLFWAHPHGVVELLATFLCRALQALQVDVNPINVSPHSDLAGLLPSASDFDLAISVGIVPLAKRIDGRPIYDVFGDTFYLWSLDTVIYEFRSRHVRQYLKMARRQERLRFLILDRDSADFVAAVTSPRQSRYFPFAGNFEAAPRQREIAARLPRLAIVGTIGSELGGAPHSRSLAELAGTIAPRGVSSARLRGYLEAVEAVGGKTHTARVAQDTLGIEPDALLSAEWLDFVMQVDSYEKRRRRLLAANSLRGIPVDFFGSGWDRYVEDCDSFRFCEPVSYAGLGQLFRRYSGVVNFDPNWDDGLHDRVYTALGSGCRVITNHNRAIDEIGAPPGTVLTYDANRPDAGDGAAAIVAGQPVADASVLAFRRENSWLARVDAFLGSET